MFYTSGELKFPGDKLVALLGLAKDWGQLRGFPASSYLAGLWQRHLPYYLCWYSMSNWLSNRPAQYRAPTWSRTSIDRQVQPTGLVPNNKYNPVSYAQVIAAQRTLADGSLDDYGPITGVFLHMRVHMCALQMIVDDESLQNDGRYWRTSSGEDDEECITICWDEKSQDLAAPQIPEGELYLSVVLGFYALEDRTLLDPPSY